MQGRVRSVGRVRASNAGHSAAIFLEGTAVERVHSFDLMTHSYSHGQVGLLQRLYAGRLTTHAGDSARTLLRFAADLERTGEPKCDVWFIDGRHTGDGPTLDMTNAIFSSHNRTLLFADDCTHHWRDVRMAFDRLLAERRLVTYTSTRGEPLLPEHIYDRKAQSGVCAARVAPGRAGCQPTDGRAVRSGRVQL